MKNEEDKGEAKELDDEDKIKSDDSASDASEGSKDIDDDKEVKATKNEET